MCPLADYICFPDLLCVSYNYVGPTVLFKRYYSKKGPREFYACAVHRDRKGCPFFHWADEKITPEKQKRYNYIVPLIPTYNRVLVPLPVQIVQLRLIATSLYYS